MTAQRNGYVHIHDTALHIWEEGVNEVEFERVVWGPLIGVMRKRGWTMHTDPDVAKNHPVIAHFHRSGAKGPLRCTTRAGGRHFELEIWSEDWPSDNANGHRYCFRKRERMPYLTGLKADLELRTLKAWLDIKHGYAPCGDNGDRRPVSAMAYLSKYYAQSGHADPVLGRPKPRNFHDDKAADGSVLEHGSVVWTRARDGRVRRGRAYYKLGSNWLVVFSDFDYSHVEARELMTSCPDGLGRKVDPARRRERLEHLINAAVRDDDFDRAKLLRRVLFSDAPLYRIKKGDTYYAPVSKGYGSTGHAGRYTAEEAQGLIDASRGELKAVPIGTAPPLHPAVRAKAVTP